MLEGLFLGAVSPAAQSTLKSYPLALNGVRTVVVLSLPFAPEYPSTMHLQRTI